MLTEIRTLKIGEKEYKFKMTNRTVFKVDDKYGNYGKIISGIMEGEQVYTNVLKLLSCSCIEKEWTIDELLEEATPKQLNLEMPNFAVNLYFDYMGLNDKEDETNKEKNHMASQEIAIK